MPEQFEIHVPDEEAPETNGHSNGRSNGYANGHSNGTNGDSEKPKGQGFSVRVSFLIAKDSMSVWADRSVIDESSRHDRFE